MPAQVELAQRPARAAPHAPSAALIADAGPLAHAVARVWPRPHAPFLTAEPARRRLAALAAHHAYGDLGALAEPLETWSLKRIVAAYLSDAPPGLVEALRKITDAGWTEGDYRQLLGLLRQGEGAKTLRHAPQIDRTLIAVLAVLPDALRRPRLIAQVSTRRVADLVARGARRAAGKDEREMARLAERLERARSPQGLFRMLIDAIGLEQLAPPPVPGADWFVPIATAAAIRTAALKFENCLEGRIPLLLRGKAAYYEVAGAEPAVVEIVRDIEGLWAVGEVRGHANAVISTALWTRIRLYLEAHGARVSGASPDALAVALANAAGW